LPSGKISGEINLGIGDAAAELSGSIEAMKSCGDTALWKLRKYDLTDVSND
jgi:hypothetical protein